MPESKMYFLKRLPPIDEGEEERYEEPEVFAMVRLNDVTSVEKTHIKGFSVSPCLKVLFRNGKYEEYRYYRDGCLNQDFFAIAELIGTRDV